MVHLVLNARGEEALHLFLPRLAVIVEIAHAACRRALHVVEELRHRQAAFLVDVRLLGRINNLGIDEVTRRPVLPFVREIHDDHSLRLTDLDRGEADALRRVHALKHVVHQPAHAVVDGFDGLGDDPQAWIGSGYNGQCGHWRDVGGP